MLHARVTTGGTATIVMSRRHRELVFAAAGLRPLPSSQCYELWLMGPGGDRPAGMLPGPRQGMTGPVITSGLTAGDRLGLTVEPAGGTPHPTTTVMLDVVLLRLSIQAGRSGQLTWPVSPSPWLSGVGGTAWRRGGLPAPGGRVTPAGRPAR